MQIQGESVTEQLSNSLLEDSLEDAEERKELPFYKDPKKKISIWTIIKDSIG